jgi:hypothetical protein
VCPSVSDECTDEGPPCAEALEAPFRVHDAKLVAPFDGALLKFCGPDGPLASVAPKFCQTYVALARADHATDATAESSWSHITCGDDCTDTVEACPSAAADAQNFCPDTYPACAACRAACGAGDCASGLMESVSMETDLMIRLRDMWEGDGKKGPALGSARHSDPNGMLQSHCGAHGHTGRRADPAIFQTVS